MKHTSADKPEFNQNESVISRLFLRKDRKGNTYLTGSEYEAGERIRRDFEKANLQLSLGMQWDSMHSPSGSGKISNHKAEISDFAIDARGRLDAALKAVGPELSDVVLDICCFLKGLELVEREKRWPPRSAKLMLKTALRSLARHYGFEKTAVQRPSKITHWATSDFRPKINQNI